MNFSRCLVIILAAAVLTGAVVISLVPNPLPLKSSYTRALPVPAAKWIRKNYGAMRHLPGYLVVALFVQAAFGRRLRSIAMTMAALLVMAGFLEILQLWIPHRQCDLRDFLWGALGILLGSIPAIWCHLLWRRQTPITQESAA